MKDYFMIESLPAYTPSAKVVDDYYEDIQSNLLNPEYLTYFSRDFLYRERHHIKNMGFPLLTREFLDDLAEELKGKKVLEVMSGSGFLAKELSDRGIEIIATDNLSRKLFINYHSEIIPMDAITAIEQSKDWVDVVIMSWPETGPDGASVLSKCMNKNIPLIYIGEMGGGCCANSKFFHMVYNLCNMDWKLNTNFRSFLGFRDVCIKITKKEEE